MELQQNSAKQSGNLGGQIPPLTPEELGSEITNLNKFSAQIAKLDESHPTQVSAGVSAALAKWDWESAQEEQSKAAASLESTFIGVDPALLAETSAAIEQKKAEQQKLDQALANAAAIRQAVPESSVVASIKEIIDDYNQRMARAAMPWEPSVNYLEELLGQAGTQAASHSSDSDRPATDAASERTNPDISAIKRKLTDTTETKAESYTENDLLLPLTLENLDKRSKLNPTEIGDLYALLLAHADQQELWNFISRCTNDPINAWVIRYNLIHNTGFITPDTLESILLLGPVQDEVEIAATGEKKQVIMYGSTNLGKGGQAEVAEVFYIVLDQGFETDIAGANLKLARGAIKIAFLDNQVSKENLHYEQLVAKEVAEIIKNQQSTTDDFDPAKHLALPIIYGDGFYILPIIESHPGSSASLFQYGKALPSAKYFVRQLIGPVKVLNLLDQNNIKNCDTTDNNILISPNGGVMIDMGGFISKKQIEAGNVLLLKKPSSDLHIAAFKNGTMFESPAFTSNHIFAHELLNPEVSGLTHKIALGRMLERYLTIAGYQSIEHFKKFSEASVEGKLAHQPEHVADQDFLNRDHKTLYDLCKLLLKSMYHPTPYLDNNPANGQDSGYISLDNAIAILENLANN